MDSIVTTGSLRESGSCVARPAVWTVQGEMSVAGGGRSAASLLGRPQGHARLRNLVNPTTDLPFADRMRASASEP